MRKENHQQMPLTDVGINHPRAMELKRISRILDENPIINKMVLQDLTRGAKTSDTGAGGMSASRLSEQPWLSKWKDAATASLNSI